jgi:hypothetical protein
MLMISVHVPKTAGSSFAATLLDHYGSSLLRDYADFPINTPTYERNKAALQASIVNSERDFGDVECIHGHFLPIKYLLLSDKRATTFITWMRDPVERILSHYFFWTRHFDPETAPPLHRRVVEERWSLERFCLAEEVRNLYAQFFYGFPLERFSFIGITEFYNDDFEFFSKQYLNADLKPKNLNVGSDAKCYQISASLRRRIAEFHSQDMSLYRRALASRQQRLTTCRAWS